MSYPASGDSKILSQLTCQGGSFALESVAAFVWNGWQPCSGISGRLGVEYALYQTETKDNFLERVFSMERWHQLCTSRITVNHLADFHATHHLTLAAHGNEATMALSETISNLRDPLSHDAIDDYLKQFHDCLKTPLTHRDHVRILTNLKDFLNPVVSHDEKERLNTEITDYKGNPEKLVTLLKHIKQLADSYNLHDLSRQAYINPTPAEITLRYGKQ